MHDVSIAKGRSFCDSCKKPISWYDNIPLFSYLLLQGKCRHCHKKISARYPLIEFTTALTFVSVYLLYSMFFEIFPWLPSLGIAGIVLFCFVGFISIGIFVTDMEEMIIPDSFVFLLFLISFLFVLFSSDTNMWQRLLVAFVSSMFFLILNLATRGRGMGLGDVKLALPLGFLLGFPVSIVWIFVSFIIGSIVGVALLVSGRATKKTRVPFGPFMIVSFWVCALFGASLIQYLTPYF